MTRRRKWVIGASLILIPALGATAFFGVVYFNVFRAHEHCIKQTGNAAEFTFRASRRTTTLKSPSFGTKNQPRVATTFAGHGDHSCGKCACWMEQCG